MSETRFFRVSAGAACRHYCLKPDFFGFQRVRRAAIMPETRFFPVSEAGQKKNIPPSAECSEFSLDLFFSYSYHANLPACSRTGQLGRAGSR